MEDLFRAKLLLRDFFYALLTALRHFSPTRAYVAIQKLLTDAGLLRRGENIRCMEVSPIFPHPSPRLQTAPARGARWRKYTRTLGGVELV